MVEQFQGVGPGTWGKCLEAAGEEGLSLTKAQAQALLAQVKQWQEQARWGRSYRERLEGDGAPDTVPSSSPACLGR